jgi:transposase InsO family protein
VDAVAYATLTWVDWFNHRRLLESIGHVPPDGPPRWWNTLTVWPMTGSCQMSGIWRVS